ncbi:WD40 repeat-like protein [Histomonas meleagridis]|uniref:WD40 repeat-like protein n=1 Tax=Histomonas meleagridis TaxID=135588 RepID=UPI00355AA280|nr:WD40 repeat-like protein [Histomonas meleagridis]KAH0798094.1 WD40 repeat-like protein [Histomonas meleagridis]
MTRVISTTINGIKTYHISAETALPTQYGDKANRRIGTHAELKNRISFIQEFEFPNCSRIIQLTRDGLTLGVSGEYPPQIKIFDLADLSQTTNFFVKQIPTYFDFVSDDWSKLVSLRGDRKLDFYTKGGIYHTLNLPIRCRHFVYNRPTADLLLSSEDSQILRLNLELGHFVPSIPCCEQYGNFITVSDVHQLICCGYENGVIEFFDPRDKRSITAIKLESEVTRLCFDNTGLKLAVGLSNGKVSVFDIRSSTPQFSYSHRNQFPIHSISFHSNHKIISGDRRGCRIYNETDGTFYTSFETRSRMNNVISYPDSGLLFAAVDEEKIQAMLIPDLGPSPRWASFLDDLILDVEADAEERTPLYDDMKFITREELEKCGMEHLIKTSILKPYMHGFFVPRELYRMINNPTDVEEAISLMKKEKQAKKVAEQEKRIVQPRKAQQQNLGDLEITEFDSKRKAKKKKEMRKDPYYQN